MPIMVQFEESGPRLEAGTYEMECVGVKEDWLENPQFGDGHVVKLTFHTTNVLGEDGSPVELEAMASFKFTPAAKLTGWLRALGVAFDLGERFDLEAAVPGKRCLAKIEIDDRGEKGEFSRVSDLMALPRSQTATRAARRPAAADDEPEPPYHPGAKDGETVVDARLASEAQLNHLDHLLGDVGMTYTQVARELNLPDLETQLRVPELSRAVDYLQERKAAAVAK